MRFGISPPSEIRLPPSRMVSQREIGIFPGKVADVDCGTGTPGVGNALPIRPASTMALRAPQSVKPPRANDRDEPCVDGPRLARDFLTRRTEIACSHVSGLLLQSGRTAGPDGVREPRPHHSNGIEVPMNAAGFSRLRRIDRLCHHASLLSRKLQRLVLTA